MDKNRNFPRYQAHCRPFVVAGVVALFALALIEAFNVVSPDARLDFKAAFDRAPVSAPGNRGDAQ